MESEISTMRGHLKVLRVWDDGRVETVQDKKNSITYRGKTIMSRILGGHPNYEFGDPVNPLGVTGIALGNGGHAMASGVGGDIFGTLIAGAAPAYEDTERPATRLISTGPDTWGYNSTDGQYVPGSTYEYVENGNVPWDGTGLIGDNGWYGGLGGTATVVQPNTTLFSETFRIPLDATDGVQFPTATSVQFKATLSQTNLNYTGDWGFAQRPANWISEAGLVTGLVPTTTNQLYSTDGAEPAVGNFETTLDSKDGSGAVSLYGNANSIPPTVTNGADVFVANDNSWNMIARNCFPVVSKSSSFSLVFIWVISF